MPELHVVTGAFGYTGKYIARRLLATGHRVRTLTGHPERPNPFGDQVGVVPFNFHDMVALVSSLKGADVLYNTYWVRFEHGTTTFDRAVENTRTLIRAAEEAGVRHLVHVSIANPSLDSPLPYYRGKAVLEQAIQESRLSYAILRPTVIFGLEDILINNIAWLLRRFPVFVVPGSGDYALQPVFVEDMAKLAVDAAQAEKNVVLDAVGPEVYTFDELLHLVAGVLGRRARIVHLPPAIALTLSRLIGYLVRDVVLTPEEIQGLMADLLVSQSPPTGTTRLSDWLRQNADRVGARYTSELKRHYV